MESSYKSFLNNLTTGKTIGKFYTIFPNWIRVFGEKKCLKVKDEYRLYKDEKKEERLARRMNLY